MSDMSKNKKHNPRGAAPVGLEPPADVPEYTDEGADTLAGHETAQRQHGAPAPAHYGSAGTQTRPAKSIGEPAGSPAYYGHAQQRTTDNAALSTRTGTPSAGATVRSIGEPPGSPSYYGDAAQRGPTAAASYAAASTRAATPSVQPIGAPPGSPSYYGHSEQAPSTRRASQSAAPSRQTQTAHRPGTPKVIGEPPGTAQYFGRSGIAPAQGAYGASGDVRATQHQAAPSYSQGAIAPGGRSANASSALATVGPPPGSAAYSGRVGR
jgi:hypothetical protein